MTTNHRRALDWAGAAAAVDLPPVEEVKSRGEIYPEGDISLRNPGLACSLNRLNTPHFNPGGDILAAEAGLPPDTNFRTEIIPHTMGPMGQLESHLGSPNSS